MNPLDITKRLKKEASAIWDAIQREGRETRQLIDVLLRLSGGEKVPQEEMDGAVNQLADLAKLVPALAIFSLPGGVVWLPLLAKILPFNLMPTESFGKKKKPEK
jgi:hypothetical protein